jgi:hypothetical protein
MPMLQTPIDAEAGAATNGGRRPTIVAQTLTDQDCDDPSQVAPVLDRIDGPIARVTADGAGGHLALHPPSAPTPVGRHRTGIRFSGRLPQPAGR